MELSLFAELKRRRVFRALGAYGLAAFAVLQIIEPIMHGLHWPDAVLSYVVVALALGFPVAVAVAWVYDLNQGRIERSPAASARLTSLAIGASVLVAGGVAAGYFAARRPAQPAPPAAVAVLPFVNFSSDKESDYFSDGITEELINALANVEGLRVASRTAVFAMKGRALSVPQIGAELNVGTLLEGSIRREGNALRVTAQLINVQDGYHLWSKTYDRELKNVFALEDEIAQSIAGALTRTLVKIKAPTEDMAAHDLYLKGRFFLNKRDGPSLSKAAGFFEEAVGRDPAYALAWAGLADSLTLRHELDSGAASPARQKAEEAARRALELDPALGEAHASMGLLLMTRGNLNGALTELRRATELSPGYAMAWKWSANVQLGLGNIDGAQALLTHVLQLDPTSQIANTNLGDVLAFRRDYEGAVQQYRKTLEMDPAFEPARGGLVMALTSAGRTDEALAEMGRMQGSSEPWRGAFRAWVMAHAGRADEARTMVRALEERRARENFSPAMLADVWMALGEPERALALLRQSCTEHSSLMHVRYSKDYDPLRNDPRLAELLRCGQVQ